MTVRTDVLVVGAGFAGLEAACALSGTGRDVLVIERAAGVGGTWRDNTYPGIACDVPSHLYGLARHPNPHWRGVFATGAELRGYLEGIVHAEGLTVRTGTPLRSATWTGTHWSVDTGDGTIEAADLVLACGRLSEPKIPDIPGLDTFPGALFHSARWDHEADLDGARVAVVGTGASAVQMAPAIARSAASVTMFQRTPAWIVPRGGRAYTDDERRRFAEDPAALAALRDELFAADDARYASRSGDAAAAAAAQAVALEHLTAQVPDPALRALLTPAYAFGCKRVLLSDDFYPALSSGAVALEPSALASVEGRTLVAASGARYEADIVVLATGFEASRQPYAALVRGEGGATLDEHWSRGMTSFGSTVVSGFPNLFVLNGPNASLGHSSAVLMMEAQAEYVRRALERRDALGGGALRVRPEAEAAYTAEVDAAAAGTPWLTGGCRNWYVDERSGRLTLLWPGTVEAFRARLAAADGSEFLPAAVEAVP